MRSSTRRRAQQCSPPGRSRARPDAAESDLWHAPDPLESLRPKRPNNQRVSPDSARSVGSEAPTLRVGDGCLASGRTLEADLSELRSHKDEWAAVDPAGKNLAARGGNSTGQISPPADGWRRLRLRKASVPIRIWQARNGWRDPTGSWSRQVRCGGHLQDSTGASTRSSGAGSRPGRTAGPSSGSSRSNGGSRCSSAATGSMYGCEPGVTPANLSDHTAQFYRNPPPDGRVCAVLGAGNIASIPPLDVLYKLFAEGQVVALKLSPVNDYLGRSTPRSSPISSIAGFLRFFYGGNETGAAPRQQPGGGHGSHHRQRTFPRPNRVWQRSRGEPNVVGGTNQFSTSPSPANWAASARSSWSPGRGARPTCAIRPNISSLRR